MRKTVIIKKNQSKYYAYLIGVFILILLMLLGLSYWKIIPEIPLISYLVNNEQLSAKNLKNIAQQITVKIIDNSQNDLVAIASGTIIGKEGNKYLIITNAHVPFNSEGLPPNSSALLKSETFKIITFDEQIHQATLISNPELADSDLALFEFTSNETYPLAKIANSLPKEGEKVLASGYINTNQELIISEGEITIIPQKSLQEGYQIGYTSNIEKGMSGGAILNTKGEIIGINGRSANPILNTGFIYEDETKPTPSEIEQYRQVSWGIPSVKFFQID